MFIYSLNSTREKQLICGKLLKFFYWKLLKYLPFFYCLSVKIYWLFYRIFLALRHFGNYCYRYHYRLFYRISVLPTHPYLRPFCTSVSRCKSILLCFFGLLVGMGRLYRNSVKKVGNGNGNSNYRKAVEPKKFGKKISKFLLKDSGKNGKYLSNFR